MPFRLGSFSRFSDKLAYVTTDLYRFFDHFISLTLYSCNKNIYFKLKNMSKICNSSSRNSNSVNIFKIYNREQIKVSRIAIRKMKVAI